jgi:hypothetical protein
MMAHLANAGRLGGTTATIGRSPHGAQRKERRIMRIAATLPIALSAALISGGALAQSANSGSGNATGSTANQNNQSMSHQGTSNQTLPQQVQAKLRDQGFTDVKVVPGSLLVSAKDKQGDPVTMIIGPHSMTMFSVADTSDSGSTVGSSSDQGRKADKK